MSFRMGCAMWAFKGWLGGLYPLRSNHADFLKLYGERFTTVEGNTTFYATPSQETVDKWALETPPDFHFCPKLPRSVTHEGLLASRAADARRFQERMGRLGTRLGPSFLQLPPEYKPDMIDDLDAFLSAGWDWALSPLCVEVRHPDWFKEEHARALDLLLRMKGAGRVYLDSRAVYEGPTDPDPFEGCERRKPYLPVRPTVTASFAFIRFISHPQIDWNEGYLNQWASWIERRMELGTQVYFFVHCPQEEQSPEIARNFQRLLERRGVKVPPLPWDHLKKLGVGQLALF